MKSLNHKAVLLARATSRLAYWIVTPHRSRLRARALRERMATGSDLSTALKAMLFSPTRAPVPINAHEYDRWVKLHDTLTDDDRVEIRRQIEEMTATPLISIIVPVYETPETFLREMIASIRTQLYPNWELCLADDASPSDHVAEILAREANADARIKWVRREKNGNIAAASNSALELANGSFVALLDHDDILPENALFEIALEIQSHPNVDIIYSDEDKIDENGRRYNPFFKPDFNMELLLGQHFINHLTVYRKELLDRIGGFRSGFDGSQDYDLILRAVTATQPDRIRHIPSILYHWRHTSRTFSQSNAEQCIINGRTAVREAIGVDAAGKPLALVGAVELAPMWNRITWRPPAEQPMVSVIIPTRDRGDLLQVAVEGLLHETDYDNLEIIVVDNQSILPRTLALFDAWKNEPRIRVLKIDGPFNYSALNNEAARHAKGEILLLLNNDIKIIKSDWLRELVTHAVREGVGAVGAKLLYGDGRVQHAGVRLGAGYHDDDPGVAGHVGVFESRHSIGYNGMLVLARETAAVTAACVAIPRRVYEQVGGLDEVNLKIAFNDIDICLRIREAGYRVVWTPFSELFHLESATRGPDTTPQNAARFRSEVEYMRRRWSQTLDNDPFYNPNFDIHRLDFAFAYPPRRKKSWHRSAELSSPEAGERDDDAAPVSTVS